MVYSDLMLIIRRPFHLALCRPTCLPRPISVDDFQLCCSVDLYYSGPGLDVTVGIKPVVLCCLIIAV